MNAVEFDLNALTAEFKQAMQDLYGDRLAKVILYGSYARGDFHTESDVDFMVVLKGNEPNRVAEVERFSPVAMELEFKYNTLVSTIVVSESRYQQSDYLFFCNVRREGNVL